MSKSTRTTEGFRAASAAKQAVELAAAIAGPPQEYPFAYALIEETPGKWSAVLLEGVRAEAMERLEVNGQPEPQGRAMMRAISAIERRTIAKKWSKP